MGQRGKIFFIAFLCVSEHFESIETHFFFPKIFVSAKRETRASEASEMRAQSAKPEGAKRPSSPAGLAGRSAERACKLVVYILGTWNVQVYKLGFEIIAPFL